MSDSLVTEITNAGNPVDAILRTDRMPHIWCPGCGIGTTVNSFARALIDSKIDLGSLALVSGIGCTGRVAGYVKLDSFHTTHGRAIPFATGLKLANPNLNGLHLDFWSSHIRFIFARPGTFWALATFHW